VTNIVKHIYFDNWQLLPTINLLAYKIRSLNDGFSLPLECPSLSARNVLMMGVVNVLGGMARNFARD
jgi:hypothetical protein